MGQPDTESMGLTAEKPNSICLKRGTKGDYGWDIKIYYDDGTMDDVVLERIGLIDMQLKEKYGHGM